MTPTHSNSLRPPAFSLVELLVVLLVLVALLSLSVVGIRSARFRASDVTCQSHCRSIGAMVSVYALDFRSAYPVWIRVPPDGDPNNAWSSSYSLQAFRLLASARWLRYTGTVASDPVYRCPGNQRFRVGEKVPSDYVGSSAMYAEIGFLNPLLPKSSWTPRLGAKPQAIDSVTFPSAKAGLFEELIWHSWGGVYAVGGVETGLTFFDSDRRANMWFFDGHVQGLSYSSALPGVRRDPNWWSAKVVLTENGVGGRDR